MIAVIDFETTGLSPAMGARATEIAAVLVEGGRLVGRFQSLMRTGAWIPPFIEGLTGISNAMVADAPPAAEVMREVRAFTGGCPLVAHNASFDRAFWQAECALAGLPEADEPFACTLLLARRLWPEAPNHKLGTLAAEHGIAPTGRAHRALADAEMAAQLWLRLQRDVERRCPEALGDDGASHAVLARLQRASRAQLAGHGALARWLTRHAPV